jgi:hypothetical protein
LVSVRARAGLLGIRINVPATVPPDIAKRLRARHLY